jgi:hypothetical protein
MLFNNQALLLATWTLALTGPSSQASLPIPRRSALKKYTNSTCPSTPSGNTTDFSAPLRFSADGTFQLSIFQDLHFGENAWDQWGPELDKNTVRVLDDLLGYESSTSLAVLNGDLITGENQYLFNATDYVDMLVGPMVKHGVSWASTYGNHDYDFNISGTVILERERRYPNSRTTSMVPGASAGVSNYYLPVYDSTCTSDSPHDSCRPELILWFFDSRGGSLYQTRNDQGGKVGQGNWVDESVVSWFLSTSAALSRQHGNGSSSAIPSLAFVHIPTEASLALQRAGVDKSRQPGINDDVPLAAQSQGWCPDGSGGNPSCAYGGQDLPFMRAIASVPGLMAVFSGHDHGDTWCYKWEDEVVSGVAPTNGVNLCFGQHTGYGGYGNWERGARQVLVNRDKVKEFAVDSWIRLEGGAVVGRVGLNATYGRDAYPETPNTMTGCKTCDWSVITPMPGTE